MSPAAKPKQTTTLWKSCPVCPRPRAAQSPVPLTTPCGQPLPHQGEPPPLRLAGGQYQLCTCLQLLPEERLSGPVSRAHHHRPSLAAPWASTLCWPQPPTTVAVARLGGHRNLARADWRNALAAGSQSQPRTVMDTTSPPSTPLASPSRWPRSQNPARNQRGPCRRHGCIPQDVCCPRHHQRPVQHLTQPQPRLLAGAGKGAAALCPAWD